MVREIPVAPGEEHWLLDTSLDEVYWPCSHSRAIPGLLYQMHTEFYIIEGCDKENTSWKAAHSAVYIQKAMS